MANEVKRVRRKRRVQSGRSRSAGFRVGRLAIYAAAVLAGFAVGVLCLTYAPRAYSGWRESRLLKRATALMAQEDLEQATRAAQQMLQIRPDSIAAFRILADATEKQNWPETVAWRAHIARALPHDLDAHLNLASAALRFGQLDAARRALESIRPEDREKAAYHVVAGWLARAEGNDAGVENHFAAAVKQEPENDLYQFNLAVLRVRSLDQEKSSAARETLDRLKKVPAFRAGSLRALLADAVQRDDLAKADALAQDLQMSQQVTFADYLLCLDLYRKLDEEKFEALLEKVKPVAARAPRDVAALMDWMNRNGLAAEVLKWTDKLPPEITTVPPPAVSVAEAFAEVKNWSRLRRWTRSGAWGDSEYLRWAYQTYAARQSRESAAETEAGSLWSSAERAASEQPEREANLARLAAKWGLAAEAKQLWRRVAKHPPFRREALDALFRIHRTNNELQDLLQVSRQLHESSPRETSLTSNYARLALLLAPNTEEARRKAKEAYDAAPKDANAAVTYAFALYHLGRTAEGLDVLKQVPREELEDPHRAAYAAVLFLDENQPDAAREYVETAQRGPLYPEEKKLLDEALSKAQPGPQPQPIPPAAPQPSPAPAAATPGPMR
ncbi:MAG: tetratricopeptide repeat protein [Verrucomicrobiota bacterium]|nr:tetratricopeptide repeat protein [Verrucomicrobiota bacterium]